MRLLRLVKKLLFFGIFVVCSISSHISSLDNMPEFNIGIILVIVASLSTFLFATKELLMNPPQTHHFRRQLSIDPKTVTYKSHSQSNNYPITNTKQQVTLVHSESQPKNMPQYSTTTTQQTTGENRMASGPFPSEIEHGTLQHSQALLQQQSGTQSDGYNRNEQGTQTMNTNYESTDSERSGYNGQRTVDSSQIGREWNSGNSAVSATNNRLSSNGMSSGGHLLEEERSSSMTSSDTETTTGGLRSSGGLWSFEASSTTDAATKNSNKSSSSPTGGLRFHEKSVSGNSNPVVLSDGLWSSNVASHSDTSIVSDSSLGSSGMPFNAAIPSHERIPSKQTFSTSSMPKDSSGVLWSFNEGKSIGVSSSSSSSSSSGGKDSGGSEMLTGGGVQSFDEQSSGTLFSSSSGSSSGGFSSSSSRVPSGGLRSSFGARSGDLQISSDVKNSVEQIDYSTIPHKGSNGMLQRDSQGQKSRRKLEFVHITKTGTLGEDYFVLVLTASPCRHTHILYLFICLCKVVQPLKQQLQAKPTSCGVLVIIALSSTRNVIAPTGRKCSDALRSACLQD